MTHWKKLWKMIQKCGLEHNKVNKIPSKIPPDNILQVVAQIRFSSDLIKEARLGTILGDLSKEYPNLTTLPANNITPDILKNDKSLEFIALHSLSNNDNNNISVEIGFNMVSIIMKKQYLEWKAYSKHVHNVIKIIIDKLQIKISNNMQNMQTSPYAFFVEKNNFTSMVECRNDGLVGNNEGSLIV